MSSVKSTASTVIMSSSSRSQKPPTTTNNVPNSSATTESDEMETTDTPSSPSSFPTEYHGQCYCGEVQFVIDIDVIPNKALYCHCESCRRAHAAPLYHVVYISPIYFHITRGEEHLRAYGRSSTSVHRSFCTNCGSRVFNILPSQPELGVGFFPALLEEEVQQNLPRVFRAKYHYLARESVLDLEHFEDHLPRK